MSSVGTKGFGAERKTQAGKVGKYREIFGLGLFMGFVDNNKRTEYCQAYPLTALPSSSMSPAA